jgi:hypothetical protein
MAKDEVRIFTPTGMLGYGFPAKLFREVIETRPDAIICDSGSTDSGPQKLGLGAMTCSRGAYVKDISLLLEANAAKGIPIYISSAGGDGTNAHVDAFLDIIGEVAAHEGYRLKVAAIYADIDKAEITRKIGAGRVAPCGPVPELNASEVAAATCIVAQMGAEPYLKVLDQHGDVDVIVSGRSYDPAPFAAVGLREGFDPGVCWHIGKIMECGGLCAEPKGRMMTGVLRHDEFELEPPNPAERCTTWSVAAHTLYEKSHPYLLPGPGGVLDLSQATYEQMTDRRVRVRGSRFVPSPSYAIKLEGAKTVGFRTIFIAGARDPIFIRELDGVIAQVREQVRDYFPDVAPESYKLIFHEYGKNGVMAELEPLRNAISHEICVIAEVAAPTQELATAICNKARVDLMHLAYPGQLATGGNLASPFTPLEIPLGEVCAFNVYHLMEVDSPTANFPIKIVEI